jgi:hypothetical protein
MSENLAAMWSSEIATERSHSTASVIVVFSWVRYSSALMGPKRGIEGRRRQRETPAKARTKYIKSVTCYKPLVCRPKRGGCRGVGGEWAVPSFHSSRRAVHVVGFVYSTAK